jgi:membrane protein implicated in regulation of membrane protease activity
VRALCNACRVILILTLLLAFLVLSPPWSVIIVLAGLVLEGGEIAWGLRLAKRRKRTGVDTIIGRRGEVVVRLDPVGQVMLGGERWTARSRASTIEVGHPVTVDAIEGVTLVVSDATPSP